MKKLLLPLLLYSSVSPAQNGSVIAKTALNRFIENSSVQWAAYSNDTSSFAGTGITELLFKQYAAGKIKGIIPVENGHSDEDHFINRSENELLQFLFPPDIVYNGDKRTVKKAAASQLTELMKSPVYDLYTIFYVQDGIPHSYISRVSPKAGITTASGLYLGLLEAVSFSVNKNYKAVQGLKDKMLYLGEIDKTFYPDSLTKHERLKETFGRNLIETLWLYVRLGKINLFSVPDNQKITAVQLAKGDYPGAEKIQVPVYDSLGTPKGLEYSYAEIDAGSFDKVVLTEKIYYDETKDIFLSKIKEMVLFKPDYEHDRVSTATFRLQF